MNNIKAIIMDVDGTLTDGKLYLTDVGEAFKVFDVKDGLAIKEKLPLMNIIPIIITGRESAILKKRCEELGILHLYQGISDKASIIETIINELSLPKDSLAYIGDDDNDLGGMDLAAIIGCPADASTNVKKKADFISSKNGGDGAVREFIEWLGGNA
ncbi:MAG: HAD hydrolase family protein [Lachnospiraceae bacterium]|nr:HAD hydrolase family protein [Lachnospiraceae bacterium]